MLSLDTTNTTEARNANLKKLADYLLAIPEDYTQFHMDDFCSYHSKQSSSVLAKPFEATHALTQCGTVACALGHGPAAGIEPRFDESWRTYAMRCFIPPSGFNSYEYQFIFGAEWSIVDNTPQGAAKRILFYLKNGIPDDFHGMWTGDTPLYYLEETSDS